MKDMSFDIALLRVHLANHYEKLFDQLPKDEEALDGFLEMIQKRVCAKSRPLIIPSQEDMKKLNIHISTEGELK